MTNIHAAYVSAFAELSNPTKDRTADAGHYSYRYADLATILDHVRPVLAKHELALSQNVTTADDGRLEVWTYLHHSSGDVLTFGPLSGRASASWQDTGSAITYARRYALGAALGIAPEDDDDAATAPAPVKVNASPKITRSKPTAPVVDEWSTPADPFEVNAARAIEEIAAQLGAEPLPGDNLRGPARRSYDNTRRGASEKQRAVIVGKLKANYDHVVDEDTALVQAVSILVEAGDAKPGEVDGWEDLTRRMIDRLFAVGGAR